MDTPLDMDLAQFRTQISDALAEGGTQPLTRLTDEELAVLDPGETLVPTPHLSAMEPQQREWAMATALRSLVSRETVEIRNIEELDAVLHQTPQATIDMHIRLEVDLALTLRRTANRALALHQHTAAGTTFAHVHIHTTNLLLVERITAGGMHLFTLTGKATDAADLLHPILDPFGVADHDGPSTLLNPSALDHDHTGPLATVIDNARVVTQLVLLSHPPGPMTTTYATDHAVWAVTVDNPHAPTGIAARAMSATALHRHITAMLTTGDQESPHA